MNKRWLKMPHLIRSTLLRTFVKLLDERAKVYIGKRVSKMNGDIRVAFDILKSALNGLKQMADDMMSYEDIVVPDLIMK